MFRSELVSKLWFPFPPASGGSSLWDAHFYRRPGLQLASSSLLLHPPGQCCLCSDHTPKCRGVQGAGAAQVSHPCLSSRFQLHRILALPVAGIGSGWMALEKMLHVGMPRPLKVKRKEFQRSTLCAHLRDPGRLPGALEGRGLVRQKDGGGHA